MDAGCFVCQRTPPDLQVEAPRRWLAPRVACVEHASAGAVEEGPPLALVLEPPWPPGLDGAAANVLFNPLRLGPWRAWLDVTSRGRAVLEELFPSADYFEYAALHAARYVEVLYEVQELARFAHREPLGVLAALGADNARYTAVQALLALWSSARAVQAVMAGAGLRHPRTLEEAARVWEAGRALAERGESHPDRLRQFLVALLRLAGRRFLHLGPGRG